MAAERSTGANIGCGFGEEERKREYIYIKREESGRVNKKLDRSWEQRKVWGGAVLLGCEPRANRAVWTGVTRAAGGHKCTAE